MSCVAAFLTGCASPEPQYAVARRTAPAAVPAAAATAAKPAPVQSPPPPVASPPVSLPPVVTVPAAPVIVPAAPLLPTVVTSPPPVQPVAMPAWPTNWVNAWIALESWSRFNGLEAPRQLGSGFNATYQIATSNGVLMLKPGGQTLRFSGLDFWLGFTPRLIQGRPYIHSSDARKTLQPLLDLFPFVPPKASGVVVIDAGHGGKDGGTRSCVDGSDEKHYALDWARRVERLLTARGWKVVLTRTNDTYLTLAERVALAERVQADVFLSLHFNAAPGNSELAGIETYCLPPAGMPSTLKRGFEDDPQEVLPNNAFDDRNFQWATALHRAVIAAAGGPDRGVCRARFLGVLRNQNRPAVLIEGGYLSNPAEARRIADPAHRQALAEGVAGVFP